MSNDPLPTTPATPPTIAYALRDPRIDDTRQLSKLSIYAFIWGGFLALFSCLGIVYLILGFLMFSDRVAQSANASGQMSPHWVGAFLIAMGLGYLTFGGSLAGCTIAMGVFLRQRRRWLFCVIVSAIQCMVFPIGTAIGVFALIVLMRDSIRRSFVVTAEAANG